MAPTQNGGEDLTHGTPATGLRGMLRGLSVRRLEKSLDKKAADQREQNWTLPDEGECKRWTLEELQQEYEILLKKYKQADRDQNDLVSASITDKKVTANAGNVANQCREWVHDCKKTLQSLEGAIRLIINKTDAKAAVAQACKHPTPDNVHLAMKEINDADRRIEALQSQIGGYVDALRQWLDKEPGF
jgi:flagellin-like hook-associated protein FlgL